MQSAGPQHTWYGSSCRTRGCDVPARGIDGEVIGTSARRSDEHEHDKEEVQQEELADDERAVWARTVTAESHENQNFPHPAVTKPRRGEVK